MKKMMLSLLLGIGLSAAALYFAFRNVPLDQLGSYLKTFNYWWALPATAITILSFVLRAIRWQVILKTEYDVRLAGAYHPLIIGFMLNCIMPGRIGEIARPVILHQQEKIPFTTGLATVALERLFDLATLILPAVLVLSSIDIDPNLKMTFGDYVIDRSTLIAVGGAMIKLSLVLLAGVVFLSIDRTRGWLKKLILGLPKLFFFGSAEIKQSIGDKICLPIARIIDHFAQGFALLRQPGQMAKCLLLSLAIWLLGVVSYYIVALGTPGLEVTFMQIFASFLIICFVIALPSVPGFWGLWEAGGVFALSLFGIADKAAAGYTLANHAIQIIPIVILGLGSALITGINVWQVSINPPKSNKPKEHYGKTADHTNLSG